MEGDGGCLEDERPGKSAHLELQLRHFFGSFSWLPGLSLMRSSSLNITQSSGGATCWGGDLPAAPIFW